MDERQTRDAARGPESGGNIIQRVVRWFQDYWYFYRIPILLGLFGFVILFGIFLSIVTKEKTDFTVAFVSQVGMSETERDTLKKNFSAHLPDVDGNGKTAVGITPIQIGVALSDEFAVAAYDSLTSMLLFDEVVFLVVDDFAARYLEDIQALEPLSALGIKGGENEYRIKISDTDLLKDTTLGEYIDFYIVVKAFSETERNDSRYLARRAAIRPMLEEVLP